MIKLNMKKTILLLILATISVISCRKDDPTSTEPEVSIETQNTYDDQAIVEFLKTHYLDARGNVKDFMETDTVNTKLFDLNPVTLPSGVVYVKKASSQPVPGTEIGDKDSLRLMNIATTYVAQSTDGKVKFGSSYPFRNTVSTGNPEVDPAYYYVKNSVLAAFNTKYGTSYDHSYYEIEGFREALQKFRAFDIPDEDNYNLQGVIIVPSRAAFARDPHFNYSNISFRNRSFIFNFQVYKTTPRIIP